jgi:hypothetical protein
LRVGDDLDLQTDLQLEEAYLHVILGEHSAAVRVLAQYVKAKAIVKGQVAHDARWRPLQEDSTFRRIVADVREPHGELIGASLWLKAPMVGGSGTLSGPKGVCDRRRRRPRSLNSIFPAPAPERRLERDIVREEELFDWRLCHEKGIGVLELDANSTHAIPKHPDLRGTGTPGPLDAVTTSASLCRFPTFSSLTTANLFSSSTTRNAVRRGSISGLPRNRSSFAVSFGSVMLALRNEEGPGYPVEPVVGI